MGETKGFTGAGLVARRRAGAKSAGRVVAALEEAVAVATGGRAGATAAFERERFD